MNNLPNPGNPGDVIDDMVELFLPKGTTETQKLALKDVLTDGLPDFEWSVQYQEYINAPNDTDKSESVMKRIKETLTALFELPEFQTM